MNTDILSYIPQRPPFILLDEIVESTDLHTTSTFKIQDDNLFVNNGVFSESGMVENMAQTAGAGVGYRRLKADLPLQSGYIAALKNVIVHALPAVNDTITTHITMEQTIMSFQLVRGTVSCEGRELASCEFKIFVQNKQ